MLHHVEIIGWRPGFRKIRTTVLLRDFCALSLTEAKALTDTILLGVVVALPLDTLPRAYDLAHQLQLLGAIVRLDDPNSSLLDNTFVTWLAQELSRIMHTPIAGDQRLGVTRHVMETFADKLRTIAIGEHQHILTMIDCWSRQKAIDDTPIPQDKATVDWLEGISGTIAGMIEDV